MMPATDVTYLFFQRDTDKADNGPLSPVIKTTRVVQHPVAGGGRLRSGSVPPGSLRAGSQPPGTRSGSVAPSTRAGSVVPHHVTTTSGPRGIIKQRASTTTVVRAVRGDGTTGVVTGPPRSSVHRRRASISVVPSRTSAAAAAAARPTGASHQPIFRAEAFLKSVPSDRADAIKPSRTRQLSSSAVHPSSSSSSSVNRRRSSISVHDTSRRPSTVSPTLNSSPPQRHLSAATHDAAVHTDLKSQDYVTTPAAVQALFDKHLSKSSLVDLRNRADAARDRLSRHRVLIDRYLPTYMYLGPTDDVHDVVEYKVSQLYDRMPQLDPNRSRYVHEDSDEVRASPITLVAPYQPLKSTPRLEAPPVPVTTTVFAPKISDVRKRARSVLCKVKGDPHYFNL